MASIHVALIQKQQLEPAHTVYSETAYRTLVAFGAVRTALYPFNQAWQPSKWMRKKAQNGLGTKVMADRTFESFQLH